MADRAPDDEHTAGAALPEPARYFPFEDGTYEVKPGLKRFGTDFGNGPVEGFVFQLDRDFVHYRAQKEQARSTRLAECLLTHDFAPDVDAAVTEFVVGRLVREHPGQFHLETHNGNGRTLDCALTGERLAFDPAWQLVPEQTVAHCQPGYGCALDALGCQIQEDLAVTSVRDQDHWLSALHVCLPSHWSPRTKIGRTFAEVHRPVAGMEKMNQQQEHFVRQMLAADAGLVRFVWGIQSGARLNRHPDLPVHDPVVFERMSVRVERQTIWGLGPVRASLFTIRPYLVSVESIRDDSRLCRALIAAVKGMTVESLRYKGMESWQAEFVEWLAQD